MFSGELTLPATMMKIKELKGEFEKPEDRDEYLKQIRNVDIGKRGVGPLRPQQEYQELLDSLVSIYNQ